MKSLSNPIVDIGVNLMHRSFQQDREEVMERALAQGVSPLIVTGTSLRSSTEGARYAGGHPGKLYSTAGVHPHDAKSFTKETLNGLKKLAELPQVVAIGECGLDYNRDFSPRDVQRKVFEEQIGLALERNMPLFLHEREAFSDFVAILDKHAVQKAVVHCFTGTAAELQAYLDRGFYIGITGWVCDERRGKHLQQLLPMIPPGRLMIESDAPFLTPRDLRPKPVDGRNEPAFLPHILNAVALCLGKSPEEVARATTATAMEFFEIGAK